MPPTEPQFQRHLRAARAGDRSALRWFWDSYAGPITGFLLARGTPEVDEVVNDVFVAAFEQLDRFAGGEGEFRAWLFAIARNKRVDQLRRHGRRPLRAALDDLGHVATDAVEDEALRAVGDLELLEVLGSLTTEQRDVIVLRFVVDLSLEQTAAAVDKSVGAVKATQHRALAQLRKRFAADPYPGTGHPTM